MSSVGSRARETAHKVARHWRWGREQGFGRLVEEDQLDPVARATTAWRKWAWRRREGVEPGSAVAVFLVGVQRSGTNMLVRGLEAASPFEVHNENDRRAFVEFRLRDDATVHGIVDRSRHQFVLFKPLCDSHRTVELLDGFAPARRRAIWAYRAVDGRVRSAVSKFGAANLEVLTEIAEGRGLDRWQAQGMSEENLALVRSFDYSTMTPESAAALFWYVRNSLYFELGLQERDDVILCSYEDLVAEPVPTMRTLCQFLGFPYAHELVTHIDARSVAPRPLDLDPTVRERCDELALRLDAATRAKAAQVAG